MGTYEDSRVLVLNSRFATKLNGSANSNIFWEFNGLLKEDSNIIHSRIQLIACQMPRSFYTININNNMLFYTVGATIFSIAIPFGNYNAFSLITTMTGLFLANGHSISMVISRITGKITYTGTTNFTFNFLNTTANRILGFPATSNTPSVSNVLISPFPLNLIGIQRLTLTSANLSTIANRTSATGIITQSILGTVIVDEPAFGLITHATETNVAHLLKVKIIDKIDLQISDEAGNLIDFNGIDFTMKLKISSFYEIQRDSKTTFKGITEQKAPPPPSLDNELSPPIVFSPESDLDAYLYDLERPINIK